MENIRYGRLDASDEKCIRAAELANADGFIRRLPQGYQTELSERAGNLSQGQRQLISIARAIVADPAILVLDEATSSVDTRTEVQIQEAFHRLMQGRTSFVIAHRLSTIRNADLVIVIDKGQIIEQGKHSELLEKKGFYYKLYMSQFKGTNVDTGGVRLTPPERLAPQVPTSGMSGIPGMSGMRGGSGRSGLPSRLFDIVDTFKKKGATSPDTALTMEELGLPPQFFMMQSRMGSDGFIQEFNGKYYLSEKRFEEMQGRHGNM
jgi:hypothetical protein